MVGKLPMVEDWDYKCKRCGGISIKIVSISDDISPSKHRYCRDCKKEIRNLPQNKDVNFSKYKDIKTYYI